MDYTDQSLRIKFIQVFFLIILFFFSVSGEGWVWKFIMSSSMLRDDIGAWGAGVGGAEGDERSGGGIERVASVALWIFLISPRRSWTILSRSEREIPLFISMSVLSSVTTRLSSSNVTVLLVVWPVGWDDSDEDWDFASSAVTRTLILATWDAKEVRYWLIELMFIWVYVAKGVLGVWTQESSVFSVSCLNSSRSLATLVRCSTFHAWTPHAKFETRI